MATTYEHVLKGCHKFNFELCVGKSAVGASGDALRKTSEGEPFHHAVYKTWPSWRRAFTD